MKVYELAKELGVDSISLVDKLGDLNIKVKNHMSELGPQEVETARNSFAEKQAAKKAAAKTATKTRKRTATKAASAEAPAGATAAGTPATKAVRRRKAGAETSATETADASSAAEDSTPKAAPIIRRRTKESGATTETVIAPTGETTTRTMSNVHPADELASDQRAEAEAEEARAEMATEAQEQEEQAAQAEGQQTEAGDEPSAPIAPRTARPTAPRKSFLKIVEATAPPPRPMIKPPSEKKTLRPAVRGVTTQDKDGFRITKITKENLDQMVEEEAAKKRGGGKIQEVRPEDVRFADYRKKEMVFLPKRKRIPVGKELKKTELTTPKAQKRVVEVDGAISVQDLGNQMGVKAVELVRKLMGMGQMVTMHQTLDMDTATLIAGEYGYEVKDVSFKEEALLDVAEDKAEDLKWRPPVVTIMGHVDHGKTSLLDAIRSANVVAGEAGGITQHIGAYTVEKNGKPISFIDTPGHEAFTVMRARGANVTDIVILVVAADDGVMPQTREALSHAQAAGVPIIVAVNKIDKPQANPERVKQQLSELNLLPEDWGGQTMFVPVSAIQKTGLENLLEAILLQAEVLDLKANPDARASGTVLEARLEKGRGPVVSVLVSRGTLRVGDAVVSGSFVGKVKAMLDDKGNQIKVVTPGLAAEILGFEGVPNAGERFDSPESDSAAKAIVKNRSDATKMAATGPKMSLDDLFSKIQSGNVKELNVILKADVFGSVEAVRDSLTKLSNDQVTVKVIHSAAGGITESDVLLATASNAIIIGFNVRPETKARQLAEAEHIDIKCYNIIYELIDEVKKAMTGLLDKKKVEKFLGRAEVRQTFSVPKIGMIAGSAVIDGKMVRGANVRLLRDSRVIFEGRMSSLRRFKDDAKEVATGYECGIGLENYNDLKPGDVIEAYEIETIAAELNI